MKKKLRSVERSLLVSIKPKYSAQILGGSKQIELRRTRPRVSQGELVLIYESSPTMALVGYAIVGAIISATPKSLWPRVREWAGITRIEFESYFDGAMHGFGIKLIDVGSLRKPVHLNELRKQWKGFHPPQTYKYLSKYQTQEIFTLTS